MLYNKLTDSQKKVLFIEIFGFAYEDISEDKNGAEYVLYNHDYDELDEDHSVHKFQFNTLKDFFTYAQYVARVEGANELRDIINNELTYKIP